MLTILLSLLNVLNILLTSSECSLCDKSNNCIEMKVEEASYIVQVNSGNSTCTGVIIHLEWVLTAAQCIGNINLVTVVPGGNNTEEDYPYEKESIKVIIHPKYNTKLLGENDLALIKVDSPFDLNTVKVMLLNGYQWPRNDITYKRPCTFIGYVPSYAEEKEPHLHKYEFLAEHGYKACGGCMSYPQYSKVVCIKKRQHGGICTFDIGGPLICNNTVTAIAHKFYKLDDKCNVNETEDCYNWTTLNAFIYVCPYLNWIKLSIPEVPSKPANCKGYEVMDLDYTGTVTMSVGNKLSSIVLFIRLVVLYSII